MRRHDPQLELQQRVIREEYNDLNVTKQLSEEAYNRAVRELKRSHRGIVKAFIKA